MALTGVTERRLIDRLTHPETRDAKPIERGLDQCQMALGLGSQEQTHRTQHRQLHLTGISDRTGFIEQEHVRGLLPCQCQSFAFTVAQEKRLLHAPGVGRLLEPLDDTPSFGNRTLSLLSPYAAVAFAHHFTVYSQGHPHLTNQGWHKGKKIALGQRDQGRGVGHNP